jgi:Replicative DNA helicase
MPEDSQLPNSEETEKAILGQIILDNDLIFEAASDLVLEDFYWLSCKTTYGAMLQLSQEGKEINPISIGDVIGLRGEKVGGISWLTNLTYGLFPVRSLKTFVDILKEKKAKRDLAHLGIQLFNAAKADDESSQELMTFVDSQLDPVRESNVVGGFRSFADVAGDVSGKLADIREGKNPAISTGLRALDKAMKGGGQPGELHIWASLTGGGKSVLCKQLAQNIAMNGYPVAIVTAEMSDFEVFFRMLSPAAQVPAWKIQHGMATAYLDNLDAHVIDIANLPIWIDDKTTNIFEIKARVKSLRRYIESKKLVVSGVVQGLRVLFVDYLQLLDALSPNTSYRQILSSRAQEVALISRTLKKLAKELDIWVVAFAQFNRKANEQDENGMTEPQLHHLAESGKLEQDSDLVGIIDMEKFKVGQPLRNATLRIVKYRNGPPLPVAMTFNGDFLLYQERESKAKENTPKVEELAF